MSHPTMWLQPCAGCSDTSNVRRGEWLAVGLDGRGRLVELVYQYDEDDDFFFVFHGMTPPSGKTLRELGLER